MSQGLNKRPVRHLQLGGTRGIQHTRHDELPPIRSYRWISISASQPRDKPRGSRAARPQAVGQTDPWHQNPLSEGVLATQRLLVLLIDARTNIIARSKPIFLVKGKRLTSPGRTPKRTFGQGFVVHAEIPDSGKKNLKGTETHSLGGAY
jgi:hypothetical protein